MAVLRGAGAAPQRGSRQLGSGRAQPASEGPTAGEGHGGAPAPSPASRGDGHWHNTWLKQAGTTPGQKCLLRRACTLTAEDRQKKSVFLFSPRGGTVEHW